MQAPQSTTHCIRVDAELLRAWPLPMPSGGMSGSDAHAGRDNPDSAADPNTADNC